MPVLANSRHEDFAQNLAKGMTQLKAYHAAGYRGGKAEASRLATNPNLKKRVGELAKKTLKAVQKKPSYDPKAMFNRLSELVDRAEEQGDIKTAGAMQMFIIECFGYKDSPTLTHEDIRGVQGAVPSGADGEPDREPEPTIRFDKTIAAFKKYQRMN